MERLDEVDKAKLSKQAKIFYGDKDTLNLSMSLMGRLVIFAAGMCIDRDIKFSGAITEIADIVLDTMAHGGD